MMRVAPRIETERLILRPHRTADFADCAAMWRENLPSLHLARKFGYSTSIRAATDGDPSMLLARSVR